MKQIRFICTFFCIILFTSLEASTPINPMASDVTTITRIQSTTDGATIEIHTGQISGEIVEKNGQSFVRLSNARGFHTHQIGAPQLPAYHRLLILPELEKVQVRISNVVWIPVDLVASGLDAPILPVQPPVSKNDDPATLPFVMDNALYSSNTFWSDSLAVLESLGHLRNQNLYRLRINPVRWNPVTHDMEIAQTINLSIEYVAPDWNKTDYLYQSKSDPLFQLSSEKVLDFSTLTSNREALLNDPPKIVMVCAADFVSAMQPWVDWKERQGYTVVIGVPGQDGLGTSNTDIRSWIMELYNSGNSDDPAPSFVLIVGEHSDIPGFNGTTGAHKSDLYFGEMTGDFLPEMYVGRISAASESQVQDIVTKTLQYEQQAIDDPSYQGEVTMIGGVDSNYGPTHANGQINYGVNQYFNAEHNIYSHTYLYPESGSSEGDIINDMNSGIGFINYTAHGSETGWADPTINVGDAHSLTNDQKYFLAIANACLTAKFDYSECVGEAFLRQPNGGAVGYIGGTDYTYWDEDYYWGVGYGPVVGSGPAFDETGTGVYDGMFHENGESYSDWCTLNGTIMMRGNLAVAESGSSLENYYWEIYTLLGDPTCSTNLGQPTALPADYPATIITGTPDLSIHADPYTLVSLNDADGHLLTDRTNASGNVTLPIGDLNLPPGNVELVMTAQNRVPVMDTLQIISPDEAYLVASSPMVSDTGEWNENGQWDIGETAWVNFTVRNVGLLTAQDISVSLSTSDLFANLTPRTVHLDSLQPDSSALIDSFQVQLAGDCPNGHTVQLNVTATDNGGSVWSSPIRVTGHAPVLQTQSIWVDDENNGRLDINEIADIVLEIQNNGDCLSPGGTIELTSRDPYVAVITDAQEIAPIPVDSVETVAFSVRVLPTTTSGHVFSFQWSINGEYDFATMSSFQLPAGLIIEDFETGDFSSFDWTFSGDTDWVICSDQVGEGSFCAMSGDVGDNQNSTLSLDVSCPEEREIQFMFKVSSEAGYDGLEFYIDNTIYGPWEGEIDWQNASYTVPAGDHTLRWKYIKDHGVSSGSDCAWVDYIVLPLSGPSMFHCVPGDVNGDGQVDLFDVIRVSLIVMDQGAGSTDEEDYCGDVNYDGTLDVFDILGTADRCTNR